MTDGQSSGSNSPGIVSISSGDQGHADQKIDLGIKTGEAGERLKQAVAERGLRSEGLMGVAHEIADTFATKVSGTSKVTGQV